MVSYIFGCVGVLPGTGKGKIREKEGFIMKKWKRSLSMLLTIAMLAGNYEPFVLSAHAATESNAIADGIVNDHTSVITREDDGTTVITSDPLNSDADEGDPEDDNEGSGSGDNASGDDADSSDENGSDNGGSDDTNGTGDDGNTTGNNGTDDGNGSGDNNNGDDVNPSDDNTGNNGGNNGSDSASENAADDDTDLPDDDMDDTVSDNTADDDSVSDNNAGETSVSDNSVSDNSISENSVSENVIAEDAMNTVPEDIAVYVTDQASSLYDPTTPLFWASDFDDLGSKLVREWGYSYKPALRVELHRDMEIGYGTKPVSTGFSYPDKVGNSYVTDNTGMEVDLNGHVLTVIGSLETAGAYVHGGEIVLADNAELVVQGKTGLGLEIDQLTPGKGSSLWIGGYAGSPAAVAKIGTIGAVNEELSRATIYINAELRIGSAAHITELIMNAKKDTPATLTIAGNNTHIGKLDAKDAATVTLTESESNPEIDQLIVGKNVTIAGKGEIYVKRMTLGANILTVGSEAQGADGIIFEVSKGLSSAGGGIYAYNAGVSLEGGLGGSIDLGNKNFTILGDNSMFILDGITKGASATLNIGDDETDENGAIQHDITVQISGKDALSLKAMDVHGSAEVILADASSLTTPASIATLTVRGSMLLQDTVLNCTALNLQKGAQIEIGHVTYEYDNQSIKLDDDGNPVVSVQEFNASTLTTQTLSMATEATLLVQPGSKLSISGAATLYGDSSICNRGEVWLKNNIALKTAPGAYDLVVNMITDELTEVGSFKVDGTISSDRSGGYICMFHPERFDRADWQEDIKGYDAVAPLLYSRKSSNGAYFRTRYGQLTSSQELKLVSDDTAVASGDYQGYYALRIDAIRLYAITMEDGKTIEDYSRMTTPSSEYVVYSALTLDEIFAWMNTDDGKDIIKNKICYIYLDGATNGSSTETITIPHIIKGLVLAGPEVYVDKNEEQRNMLFFRDFSVSDRGPSVVFRNLTVVGDVLNVKGTVILSNSRASGKLQMDKLIIEDKQSGYNKSESSVTSIRGYASSADSNNYTEIIIANDARFENRGQCYIWANMIEIGDDRGTKDNHAALILHGEDSGSMCNFGKVQIGSYAEMSVEGFHGQIVFSGIGSSGENYSITLQNNDYVTVGNKIGLKHTGTMWIRDIRTFEPGTVQLGTDGLNTNVTLNLIRTPAKIGTLDLYGSGAKLIADEESPINVTNVLRLKNASLEAPAGLTSGGDTWLWDAARIYAGDHLDFKDVMVDKDSNVNGPNTIGTDGLWTLRPEIRTEEGVVIDISGELINSADTRDDGHFRMPIRLSRVKRGYLADGTTTYTPLSYGSHDTILKLHPDTAGKTGDALVTLLEEKADTQNLYDIRKCMFIIPGGDDLADHGNYSYEACADEGCIALRIVSVEVWAVAADAAPYAEPFNGTMLAEFAAYEDAVSYINSVGNANQRYYIVLYKDTTLSGSQLAMPTAGAQFAVCGDPKRNADNRVKLDLTQTSTKLKLNNSLMFWDLDVSFARGTAGTAIDLNGKTLTVCEASMENVGDIGTKGNLVLYSGSWNDTDTNPKLEIHGKLSVTNLEQTNYNLTLNGALTVTGDARLCRSETEGIGDKSKISGNLYMLESGCEIGSGTLTVSKDLFLNNGSLGSADFVDTHLVVSGNTYMANAASITLTGNVSMKNLYSASDDNEISYGKNANNYFKVTGTAAASNSMPAGVSKVNAGHYDVVDWNWVNNIAVTTTVDDIEPVALGPDVAGGVSTVVHKNAVTVWRLCLADPDKCYNASTSAERQAVAADYTNPRWGKNEDEIFPGAIVETKSDPLFFRVGNWFDSNDGTYYIIAGLKNAGGKLYMDLTPNMQVLLYTINGVEGTAVGGYATLQDAFDAIKARNDKNAEYEIMIRAYTGITDPQKNWTIPAQAKSISIYDSSNNNGELDSVKHLYLKNELNLQTNLELFEVSIVGSGYMQNPASKNPVWHGETTIKLNGFLLNLVECDLGAFYQGSEVEYLYRQDDATLSGTTYLRAVTGNGTTKTSVLCIDSGNTASDVWIYGDIKDVGEIVLLNTNLYVAGEVKTGSVIARGGTPSALYAQATYAEDGKGGCTVTPKLTISDTAFGTSAPLNIGHLIVAKDNAGKITENILSFLDVPTLLTSIQNGYTVPVFKDGTAGNDVHYVTVDLNGSAVKVVTADMNDPNCKEGVFIRSMVGKDKYTCYTVETYVPYTLSCGGQTIIGANDWKTIVDEINARKDKNAEYVVTLTGSNGNINRVSTQTVNGVEVEYGAETLTMPKAGMLKSLTVTTGSNYKDGDPIPAWNYIGDTITLTCDTTFENVRLVGYKTSEISPANKLSVTNVATNKPTLTVKIGGAYTMLVKGNLIIDSRQLFLDGSGKGTLELATGTKTAFIEAEADTYSNHIGASKPTIQVSGKFTKLAELKLNGGKLMLSAYVTTAYKDAAALAEAKATEPELDAAVLAMEDGEQIVTAGKVTVTDLSLKDAAWLGYHDGSIVTTYPSVVTVTNLTISDGSTLSAHALTVKNKLTALAHGGSSKDTIDVSGACSIKDMDVFSNNLLFKTTYKSATASNLNISGTVNTETKNENGEVIAVNRIAVSVTDPAKSASERDLLRDNGDSQVALVTTSKAAADRFVAAKADGTPSVYNGAEPNKGYQTIKSGNVIYAYKWSMIEVAVLKLAPLTSADSLPKVSDYLDNGKLKSTGLDILGYYPSYIDAVTAIDARKDATQGYAIVFRKSYANMTGSLTVPKNASYVHICGAAEERTFMTYEGAGKFDTDVYLEHVSLPTSDRKTVFTVNGAHTLSFDDVQISRGSDRFAITGIEAAKGSVRICNCADDFSLSSYAYQALPGDLNVNNLSLRNDAIGDAHKRLTLSVEGKVKVAGQLDLYKAELYAGGKFDLNNIRVRDDADPEKMAYSGIYYNRLAGDKYSLTISGTVDAQRTENGESVFFVRQNQELSELPVPENGEITQKLPDRCLLFKAPNVETDSIRWEDFDSLVKANDCFYAAKAGSLGYSVRMGESLYLDMNQAVKRIEALKDIDRVYTIEITGHIDDTNVTDNKAVSPLPAPKANTAAGVCYAYTGTKISALSYSGSMTLNAGGKTVAGGVTFRNLILYPTDERGANTVYDTSIKFQRNSNSKLVPVLSFESTYPWWDPSIKATLKSITGTKGATELRIDLPSGKHLMLTEGIKDFATVTLAAGDKVITNKNSGIGTLSLEHDAEFIAIGETKVGEVKTGAVGQNQYPAVLWTAYTEKGTGLAITRTPLFTVEGEIAGNVVVNPMNAVCTWAGDHEVIAPDNYEKHWIGREGNVPIGLPLLLAKKADPASVGIDWNSYDAGPGIRPESDKYINPYKNVSGYIMMADTFGMNLHITRDADSNGAYGRIETYASTWSEAVTIIDNLATKADYTVEFTATGEYETGKNGTRGAFICPKAANASSVKTTLGVGVPLGYVSLAYTGALNPTCSMRFERMTLNEYKGTELSSTNTINASNAVELSFRNVATQRELASKNEDHPFTLRFEKITAKKGTVTLDDTELTVNGAIDVGTLNAFGKNLTVNSAVTAGVLNMTNADLYVDGAVKAGTLYLMNGNLDAKGTITVDTLETYDDPDTAGVVSVTTESAPKASEIKVTNVVVTGDAQLHGHGKITLGTITGTSGPEQEEHNKAVEGIRWSDSIAIDDNFTAAKPESSVSMLTISGRVYGVDVEVDPYFYDWDAKDYFEASPTLWEMQVRGLIYSGDAAKAPVKGRQILNAPFLNLTDLRVVTTDPTTPGGSIELDGYGFNDGVSGEWLTSYAGSIYVTDLPAVVDVSDVLMPVNSVIGSTRFVDWEQSVAYVDRTAQASHEYTMTLRDDVGVTYVPDVQHGVEVGSKVQSVAKTFTMPKTKAPDRIRIKSADPANRICGLYSSATALTVNVNTEFNGISLNSLKINKGIVSGQNININVVAGSTLGMITCMYGTGIKNITGTATSTLSLSLLRDALRITGGIKGFGALYVDKGDLYAAEDVNVKDLRLFGAELHAANIISTGETCLSWGYAWNPGAQTWTDHRPSTLAADASEAVGKGMVTLNIIKSSEGYVISPAYQDTFVNGNNIVSKLNAKGQTQLTIKGNVETYNYNGVPAPSVSPLWISFLYGRGNTTYAVLSEGQALVNAVSTAQAAAIKDALALGYASNMPKEDEWRGNADRVSGTDNPALFVPANGKTVNVTAGH